MDGIILPVGNPIVARSLDGRRDDVVNNDYPTQSKHFIHEKHIKKRCFKMVPAINET